MHVTSPAPRAEWRALVADDPAALPEHASEWIDAVCASGRYRDASRLYTWPDGRAFVLPLVRRTGPAGLGGWLQSYPPGWGIGGPVGVGLTTDAVADIVADLRSTRPQRLSIRPNPLHSSLWAAAVGDSWGVVPRRAHVLDLTGGSGAVWQRMSQSARRGVRTAERAGVRVEVDRRGELLEDYDRLYAASVDRWAARQHEPRPLARLRARRRDPQHKLRTMASALGPAMVVTMAYLKEQPVSASITLLGQTAHYTRGATDTARTGRTQASYLVQWAAIQLACDLGCTTYHMGESGQSAPLAQYKQAFGAEPVDYAEYWCERLPYRRVDQAARTSVKRLLRFRDT